MNANELLDSLKDYSITDKCKEYLTRTVEICSYYGDTRLETKYLLLALVENEIISLNKAPIIASFGPPAKGLEYDKIIVSQTFEQFMSDLRKLESKFGLFAGEYAVFKATFVLTFLSLKKGTHLTFFYEQGLDIKTMILEARNIVYNLYMRNSEPKERDLLLFQYLSEELAEIRKELAVLTFKHNQKDEQESGY